jgi:hypothetical protein
VTHLFARITAAVLLAAPAAGGASAPGDPVQAARRRTIVTVDGRLDEPAWADAPVFDGFLQRFPAEGAEAAEGTEVRVLYDDRVLYVGVRCKDRHPELIQRALGRRDNAPYGDSVTVFVDSMHDGRNAFLFSVSAAGVLSDGLQSDDDDYSADWDAIWDGAATSDDQGWSAELAIPFTALRFRDHGDPVFGFAVRRTVGRTHEEDWSVPMPRSVRGQVARLGLLTGLTGLEPSADLELVPYAAGRLNWSPRYDDTTRPNPRLFEPNADLGLDLKTALGRGLSLQGTLNPDFGQVEADQIIQNLSTFETFFPEKRPFFTQGMDLFRPVAPQGRASPQQLFYSRRIGLSAPIVAAAKVSGSVSDTVQVGLVEAVVAGDGTGPDEAPPDRRYRFSSAHPLWFGPHLALPQLAPAPENLLAGVVRWQPDPRVSLGATATSALLLGRRCTVAESQIGDDDSRPERCNVVTGNAGALDFALRTLSGEWFLRGQATASQARGGSPERTLPDGTQLTPGDLGYGGHAALGRAGGEPLRFELHWEYESPKLDVNALGYQRTQNEQVGRAVLRWVRPSGSGPFHSYAVALVAEDHYTTDGRGLRRGGGLYQGSEFQLPTFDWFGNDLWYNLDHWDVREIDQSGVAKGLAAAPLAMQVPAELGGDLWLSTDASRVVAVDFGAGGGRYLNRPTMPSRPYWFLWANLTVRPHPRLETRINSTFNQNAWAGRWITDDGAPDPRQRQFLFASLDSPVLSVTLRQTLVLTPRLTLQVYAQLYSTAGRYSHYRLANAHRGRVGFGDMRQDVGSPQDVGWWNDGHTNPDFRDGDLVGSVVLRWEYRLGSTLYVVYSRNQRELGYPNGAYDPSPPYTATPRNLGRGPTVDTFLVKWSYWWSR